MGDKGHLNRANENGAAGNVRRTDAGRGAVMATGLGVGFL